MNIFCCCCRRRRTKNKVIHPILIDYVDGGYAIRHLKDKK